MVTKKGLTKIVNFMTLRSRVLVLGFDHIIHIYETDDFFLNRLLYSFIRKISYIRIMNEKGSTKIVNFMTPRSGVIVLRRGHMRQMVTIDVFL